MKRIAVIFIAMTMCACGGFALGIFFASPRETSGNLSAITTTQKEGAAVTVAGWNVSGDSIRFTTTAEGAGVSETVAPKTIIPEAKAYIERVHQINAVSGVLLYDRTSDPFAGGEYLYRYMNFSAGGGMLVSMHGVLGVYGKAGWMF